MSETIDVPDLQFEQGDYVEHWSGNDIARIDYIECKYPSERWSYFLDFMTDESAFGKERSRVEEDYSKVLAAECPACGNRGEYRRHKEAFRCYEDDCPVETYDGEFN